MIQALMKLDWVEQFGICVMGITLLIGAPLLCVTETKFAGGILVSITVCLVIFLGIYEMGKEAGREDCKRHGHRRRWCGSWQDEKDK